MCIRAVGEVKGKKPQGTKEDGHATVKECLDRLKVPPTDLAKVPKKSSTKPYGLAVGLVVYSFMSISLGVTGFVVSKASRMVLGTRY
jgi:hypothetical protein